MTTRRNFAATSLAAVALVALSACQGPAATTPAASSAPATTTSSSATTAKASASASSSASASASPKSSASASASPVADAKDAADFADKVTKAMKELKYYKTTLKGSAVANGQAVTTDTSMVVDQTDAANLKAQGTASVGAIAVETILIGNDNYVKQPSGKWKKQAVTAQDKDVLLQGAGDQFKKASGLKKVGTEKVDGVDTTHYVLTFPAGTIGQNETPMDVWVDSKFRTVQTKTTTDVSGAKAEATLKITDMDKKVEIKAPAADQIEG